MYSTLIEFGTPEFDECIRLRYDVLRKPLGLEFNIEEISTEYDSFHLACYNNRNELVGVLVLKPLTDQIIKMRQVAVSENVQKSGIGSYMISESENFASQRGYKRIELHARAPVVPFYEKHNYVCEGPVFQEVGIDHQFMFKMLS
ncbi:MAG: GNAT family N-acetyltransferase [Saprospiraceae bacterium]|nr:GNAT family N-acetyltransferase [Saprospiraceae bacterium]